MQLTLDTSKRKPPQTGAWPIRFTLQAMLAEERRDYTDIALSANIRSAQGDVFTASWKISFNCGRIFWFNRAIWVLEITPNKAPLIHEQKLHEKATQWAVVSVRKTQTLWPVVAKALVAELKTRETALQGDLRINAQIIFAPKDRFRQPPNSHSFSAKTAQW